MDVHRCHALRLFRKVQAPRYSLTESRKESLHELAFGLDSAARLAWISGLGGCTERGAHKHRAQGRGRKGEGEPSIFSRLFLCALPTLVTGLVMKGLPGFFFLRVPRSFRGHCRNEGDQWHPLFKLAAATSVYSATCGVQRCGSDRCEPRFLARCTLMASPDLSSRSLK